MIIDDIGEAFRREELARLPRNVDGLALDQLRQAVYHLTCRDLWVGLGAAKWWVDKLVPGIDELVFEPRWGYKVYRTFWYRDRWRKKLIENGVDVANDPASAELDLAETIPTYVVRPRKRVA